MSDLFLSYARLDEDVAKRIVEWLQARGWSVWWDPKIDVGAKVDKELKSAIASSSCFLLLWSTAAEKSDWILGELTQARKLRKEIIPLRIGDAELPLQIGGLHALELDDASSEVLQAGLRSLHNTLTRRLREPASPLRTSPRAPKPRAALRWVLLSLAAIALAVLLFHNTWRPAPITLAVLGLSVTESSSTGAWVPSALSELLSAELRANRSLRLLTSEWLQEVSENDEEEGFAAPRSSPTPPDVHALADYVLTGLSVVSEESVTLHLDLRTVPPRWHTAIELKGDLTSLGDLARNARRQIERRLRLGPATRRQAPNFADLLPAEPQALRPYSRALTAQRSGELHQARLEFETALKVEPDLALVNLRYASLLSDLGEVRDASAAATNAITLASSLPERPRLEISAASYAILRDWPAAFEAFDLLARAHPDQVEYGMQAAQMLERDDNHSAAIDALRRVEEHADGLFLGRLRLIETRALLGLGNVQDALQRARVAAEVGLRSRSALLLADARYLEAVCLERLGNRTDALAVLNEAAALFDQLQQPARHVDTVIEAAIALAGMNEPRARSEALEMLENVATSFRRLGDRSSEVEVQVNTSNILIDLGDYGGAADLAREAALFLDGTDSGSRAGQALLTLGTAQYYDYRASVFDAYDNYSTALRRFRDASDKENQALALANLGEAEILLGDLNGAFTSYKAALELSEELGNDVNDGYYLFSLWLIAIYQDRVEDVRARFAAAARFRTDDPVLGAYFDLAAAQFALAQHPPASERAAGLAQDAETVFADAGLKDDAALARIALAHSALAKDELSVPQALAMVDEAEDYGMASESRRVRFETTLLLARRDYVAQTGSDDLRQRLERLADDAAARGSLLSAYEARLLLGEIELATGVDGARMRIALLQNETETVPFLAKRAASLLAR